jgi:hypothetical protein
MRLLLLLLLSLSALPVSAGQAKEATAETPRADRCAEELNALLGPIYSRHGIPIGTTVYDSMSYFAYYEDWDQFRSEVMAVYRRYWATMQSSDRQRRSGRSR